MTISWSFGIRKNKANFTGAKINAKPVIKRIYKEECWFWVAKNKANCQPMAGNSKYEARKPKGKLKKQSQFTPKGIENNQILNVRSQRSEIKYSSSVL